MNSKFDGKKWKLDKVIVVKDYEVWYEDKYIEKPIFSMTKDYKKFLREKRKQELLHEIRLLENKLKRQTELYGETDNIDFGEYQTKVQQYYREF